MHLDHVGLSVADLDAQASWYSSAFGFVTATPFEVRTLGLRGVFLVGPGAMAIELLEREGSRPGIRAADQAEALLTHGYGHICLRVSDVDELHARLLAHGASERMAPDESPEPGVRMSFVADPEGNLIELLDRSGPVGAG
ncbi:MAG TPA: VOC family protein [Galbitalea sp.]|jgi:catechol 2,3-dioxygenase-like lactoylglutathione lyase family enzyme|nr:VOC family protein [Galbitalea sp.]